VFKTYSNGLLDISNFKEYELGVFKRATFTIAENNIEGYMNCSNGSCELYYESSDYIVEYNQSSSRYEVELKDGTATGMPVTVGLIVDGNMFQIINNVENNVKVIIENIPSS